MTIDLTPTTTRTSRKPLPATAASRPGLPAGRVEVSARPTFRDAVVRQRGALQTFVVSQLIRQDGGDFARARAYVETGRAVAEHQGESALLAWQFGVAIALAGELRRAGETAVPFESLPRAERVRDVNRVLARTSVLGGELRAALVLTAVGQMSCDDAAVLLALPQEAACARIDRAMASVNLLLAHG